MTHQRREYAQPTTITSEEVAANVMFEQIETKFISAVENYGSGRENIAH